MAHQQFRLEQLFGSKTRARLLGLFLQRPEDAFYVRELTRKIGAQLNSVRREIKNLVEFGVVLEQEVSAAEKKGVRMLSEKKKFYTVNKNFLLYADLRALFKKVSILLKQNFVQEIDERGTIDFLAFTGKFVDNTQVPTDLFLVGSIDASALSRVITSLEQELGQEINYTLMSLEEFLYRRQIADRFLLTIMDTPKVVMIDRLPARAAE